MNLEKEPVRKMGSLCWQQLCAILATVRVKSALVLSVKPTPICQPFLTAGSVTTHFHELFSFGLLSQDDATNIACFKMDIVTKPLTMTAPIPNSVLHSCAFLSYVADCLQVAFLYKMVPGISMHSYGVECASQAGLPEHVINRARSVSESYMNFKVNSSAIHLALMASYDLACSLCTAFTKSRNHSSSCTTRFWALMSKTTSKCLHSFPR